MEVGHNWGTNTGGRGNLEPVCVPGETCEPECCSSRSNYHPANGVQCALSETGVWIRLCTTLALIFPSWNLLEVSHFLGTGVFTCTLNWLFAFFFLKVSQRRVWCTASRVCSVGGQADKQLFRAHILFRILMTRLNSPTDDIPHFLCAWIVCIYVRPPTARPVVPMWIITVYVCLCVTAPSLSLSAPSRGESCWWHCPGGGAAEPALGGILCPVVRQAGVAGLPGKGTNICTAHVYSISH